MDQPRTEDTQLEKKIKQPPVLFSKTQCLMNEIREILGARLITYWNNPRGEVCHNDAVVLYDILEELGKIDMNDNSSWRRIERVGKRNRQTLLHIA
jgi:hypothetical protein